MSYGTVKKVEDSKIPKFYKANDLVYVTKKREGSRFCDVLLVAKYVRDEKEYMFSPTLKLMEVCEKDQTREVFQEIRHTADAHLYFMEHDNKEQGAAIIRLYEDRRSGFTIHDDYENGYVMLDKIEKYEKAATKKLNYEIARKLKLQKVRDEKLMADEKVSSDLPTL